MENLQDRHFLKNFVNSYFFIFLMIGLSVVISKTIVDLYYKNSLARQKREEAELKLQQLVSAKQNLTETVNSLSTKEGMERELRNKFNLVRPGEKVIVIVDEQKPKEEQVIDVEKKSFCGTIFNTFKD